MPQPQSQEDYVFSNRDQEELSRLNRQHAFLTRVTKDHLISPSIPTDSLRSIADVACGTGIWLQSLAQSLPPLNDGKRTFHGFDLDGTMFPPESERGEAEYHLLNILEPIPEEYHNRFDLVNVRLLVVAIKEKDLPLALANVTQMIRPGGYLQWFEVRSDYQGALPGHPEVHQLHEIIYSGWTKAGFAKSAITVLRQNAPASLTSIEFSDIHFDGENQELQPEARWVYMMAMRGLYTKGLLVSGEAANTSEAAEKFKAQEKYLEEIQTNDLLINAKFEHWIAKKTA